MGKRKTRKVAALEAAKEMLGKVPDYVVAARVGVSPRTVLFWRRELGIPPYSRPAPDVDGAVEEYVSGTPVKQIRIGMDRLYSELKRRGIPLRRPRRKQEVTT